MRRTITTANWTFLTTLGLSGGLVAGLLVGMPLGQIVNAMVTTAAVTCLVGGVLGGCQAFGVVLEQRHNAPAPLASRVLLLGCRARNRRLSLR